MKNITGILVYNHSLSAPKYQEILALYQAAAQGLHIKISAISNHSLQPSVQNGQFSLGISLKSVDFCLFLDKDVLLAEQIQLMGVPVFNSPESIAVCDNKIAMTQRLCQKNLPICDSFFSTTQFFPINETDFQEKVAQTLGFPLVIKEAYGSFGEQVYLAHSMEEMITIRNKISKNSYLYQRYLSAYPGQDLRIYVCGHQVVGAMKRQNSQDFRANLSIGGEIMPYEPTFEEKNLAISANQAMGTLFSGVDIIWNQQGEPVICEVNASAHIKNYENFTGENLAIPIFSGILAELK